MNVASLLQESFRREFFLLPSRIQGTRGDDEQRRIDICWRLAALTAAWLTYCDALDDALSDTAAPSPLVTVGARLETQSVLLRERLRKATLTASAWDGTTHSRARLAHELAGIAGSVADHLGDQAPLTRHDSPLHLPEQKWVIIVRSTLPVDREGLLDAVLGGGQHALDELMIAMLADGPRSPRSQPESIPPWRAGQAERPQLSTDSERFAGS